ncbi:hypothetical protein [Pseudomonas sp. PSE14]|uniref:hypothetical protein n=1 Tax=Pseudomonas sp. PSE14 TaxID=3016341 RepID=UPI0023D7DD32|nr:hypothetical protein [Pseudomonas sp. PSE14]WEJ70755.1 hypothetical protein O6P39_19105 [Pseudomonas sp. PSE14]
MDIAQSAEVDAGSCAGQVDRGRAVKRLVITLGMHRSGTSLLSAALEGLGVEYGSELIGPAPDNPKGFWEDRVVVEINERMYQALGVTSSTLGVDCTQMEAGTRWRFQLQIARWLKFRLSGEGVLGLKDPRMPRLIDIWSPVLDRLKVDYSLLIPLRNPLSVSASLTTRDGFSTGKGLLLWYEHMVRALRFAVGKRFVVIDYDRFLERPDAALGAIAAWLGLQADPQMLAWFRSQVFDPGLRHANYDLETLEQHTDSFPDLVRLYQILLALSSRHVRGAEQVLLGEIEQFDGRFADLLPLLRQCGRWDMELWATGQFCQQQEVRLRQCNESWLHRETELTKWISTLEQTIRQEQAGRAEAESWLRQVESNCQEQAKWISTLEQTIRQEQAGRAEAESWLRQVESNCQEQAKWISTLEQTIRQEQAGRAEAESWLRQVESNSQEQAAWISTLEHTIRQEQIGRAEAESWFRQAESSWREQSEACARQITALTQDLAVSRGQAQGLALEIDALRHQAGGLQLRLDQTLASRSWRLTAPLRRCREWWGRLRVSSSSN